MCNALAKCVKIDEAKDLHDKAKALAYYARHRKDPERDLLMSELTLRAEIRMGEISRQLEKVETTGPSSVRITSGGKPKEQQLKEAGISTSAANRHEGLSRKLPVAVRARVWLGDEAGTLRWNGSNWNQIGNHFSRSQHVNFPQKNSRILDSQTEMKR
jgi:hypothetical protein